MIDKIINLVLIVVISSLVGLIAFNLFAPQKEMEASAPTSAERINDMLSQVDDSMAMQQFARVETTIADAMKLAKETAPHGPEMARVLQKQGEYFLNRKKKDEAIECWKQAMDLFERTNGMEYDAVKELSVKLADYYDNHEDYKTAEGYLRRGLKAAEKASDENGQGRFYRALGVILGKDGRLEEADECETKAQRLIKEE